MPRIAWPIAAAFAAVGLSGCLTPHARPAPSRAVMDARAHKAIAAKAVCGELTSPVSVGFGFGEGALGDLATPAVDGVARQLACHPDASALVVGQADGHGTEADQRQLAQLRAEAVRGYLAAHGVAAGRLQTQVQGAAPVGDGRLVVLAEGRRW